MSQEQIYSHHFDVSIPGRGAFFHIFTQAKSLGPGPTLSVHPKGSWDLIGPSLYHHLPLTCCLIGAGNLIFLLVRDAALEQEPE